MPTVPEPLLSPRGRSGALDERRKTAPNRGRWREAMFRSPLRGGGMRLERLEETRIIELGVRPEVSERSRRKLYGRRIRQTTVSATGTRVPPRVCCPTFLQPSAYICRAASSGVNASILRVVPDGLTAWMPFGVEDATEGTRGR
jgi:hypothetical protein